MDHNIFTVFELKFEHKDTGCAYTDCTTDTIEKAHGVIRQARKLGYMLKETGIGVYRYNGFADYERIAYQTI